MQHVTKCAKNNVIGSSLCIGINNATDHANNNAEDDINNNNNIKIVIE